MRSLDGFLAAVARAPSRSVHVIPMAGLGERFSRAGVAAPKPLAPVAGAPMFERAIQSLPTPARRVLVARAEHARSEDFVGALARLPGATEVVSLDAPTDGQATSAALGAARVDADSPLLVAPCDGGYLYDPAALAALEADAEVDVAVFSGEGPPPRPLAPGDVRLAHRRRRAPRRGRRREGARPGRRPRAPGGAHGDVLVPLARPLRRALRGAAGERRAGAGRALHRRDGAPRGGRRAPRAGLRGRQVHPLGDARGARHLRLLEQRLPRGRPLGYTSR